MSQQKFFKKIVISVIIFSLVIQIGVFSFPKKADAQLTSCFSQLTGIGLGSLTGQAGGLGGGLGGIMGGDKVPVADSETQKNTQTTANQTTKLADKQTCWDALATMAAKKILHDLTNSIVEWANNGFDGNPSFIQNPQNFFKNQADEIAGGLIEGSDLAFLCDPFKFNIRISISQPSTFRNRIGCTLSDVIRNTSDFKSFTNGNFSQGGWNGWYSMTQNVQNNPYGAEFAVQTELSARQNKAQAITNQELSWGSGFFSYKDANGNVITPGKTIEDALGQTVGSDMRQLEMAHEFDTILQAITGALMKKALGGLGL